MGNKNGTPKNLKGAIKNGLSEANLQAHIRDFLAQRFGVAMMDPEISDAMVLKLKALFESIVKEQ